MNNPNQQRKANMFSCMKIMKCLNNCVNIRCLFIFICLGFSASVIFLELLVMNYERNVNSLATEAILNVGNDFRYAEAYRKVDKKLKHIKYILIWNTYNNEFIDVLPEGLGALISRNCSVINCYFTSDSNFFPDGLQKFDAIAFNGHMLSNYLINSLINPFTLPDKRWPHQKYIFMSMEPPTMYPVCSEFYDGYFNMTATYKLDSDAPYTYMVIKDSNGNLVGPKKDMKWINYSFDEKYNSDFKVDQKTKAAAWFASNCNAASRRKDYVDALDKALVKRGFAVDTFGKCGKFSCPRSNEDICFKMLEKEYYFYLSFENSFVEDYVTEKLLTAIHHNVIPVVYGGADYTRFMPPHSYLDARKQSVEELAQKMVELVQDPVKYRQYFWWKKYYSYHTQKDENLCRFCARLNDENFMNRETIYKDLRKWLDPNFESYCNT